MRIELLCVRFSTLLYILVLFLVACSDDKQEDDKVSCFHDELFSYNIRSSEDIDFFFRYNENQYDIIACGHRGGNQPGFPENCVETFENLLHYGPLIYEIDLSMTKDGVPVLMHDSTIDRTTTGKGEIGKINYDQIKRYSLIDHFGNVTPYKVPSFEEVLEWGKDKVIFTLDRKTVPLALMCEMVNAANAKNCVFIVTSISEAKEIIRFVPDARFCAYLGTIEKFREYESADLLSHISIAFMENSVVSDFALLKLLHSRKIRAMVTLINHENNYYDLINNSNLYVSSIRTSPDIIESDYPTLLLNYSVVRSQVPYYFNKTY